MEAKARAEPESAKGSPATGSNAQASETTKSKNGSILPPIEKTAGRLAIAPACLIIFLLFRLG